MKRVLMTIALVGMAATTTVPAADDVVADAATLAARQDAEERYKRLSSAYEELQAAHAALQKRVAQLAEEVRTLRESITRGGDNYATRDDLKRLGDQIHEVDKRRVEDNKQVLEQIEKQIDRLAKNLGGLAPPPPRTAPSPNAQGAAPEKGFEYVVQRDDTLLAIVRAYNEELKKQGKSGKVTLKQVLDANPTLDEKKLRIGQKIFIPLPPP